MKLINKTKNLDVVKNLKLAKKFTERMKGLLGTKSLPAEDGLWITACPSIHTLFMNFNIDVVFTDKNLTVKACFPDVKPWRMIGPVWGAYSAFEMAPGGIAKGKITVGDQLDVVY